MSETICTLKNGKGSSVSVMNYGAAVTSLRVPDRNGDIADVVLGFDSLAGYRAHGWYCGATIGRYAGRIRNSRFSLDGRNYELSANEGPHHLHGGTVGFDKAFWEARSIPAEQAIRLRHISPDGDQGYAGTLDAAVSYTLTDEDALIIDFAATSDRPTPINLTHHGYFNLAGQGDVLGHELMINADEFAEIDEAIIPTGKLLGVGGTPFDFRRSMTIGSRISDAHPQLEIGRGYDHDYCVRDVGAEFLGARFAARVFEPSSGRLLEVFTTEPVVHFYSGHAIPDAPLGKSGRRYGPYSGFALETQGFSDAPNQPHFPSTILRQGEQFRARTVFRFSVAETV